MGSSQSILCSGRAAVQQGLASTTACTQAPCLGRSGYAATCVRCAREDLSPRGKHFVSEQGELPSIAAPGHRAVPLRKSSDASRSPSSTAVHESRSSTTSTVRLEKAGASFLIWIIVLYLRTSWPRTANAPHAVAGQCASAAEAPHTGFQLGRGVAIRKAAFLIDTQADQSSARHLTYSAVQGTGRTKETSRRSGEAAECPDCTRV